MAMLAEGRQPSNSQSRFDHAGAGPPRVELVATGVGLASFLVTELMHFLLVPDIGRRWERLLAESVSAVVVGLLTAMLMKAVNRHRAATLLRLQVISEMNQHVRSALMEISVTAESIENQQCIQKISENVDHIEWALREILLRPRPVIENPLWKKGDLPSQRAVRKRGGGDAIQL